MSYRRVIPRDLFNESKLLKCLGRIYIESERQPEGKVTISHHSPEVSNAGFDVRQDASSGAIYVSNIVVTVNGKYVHVYTGLNTRDAHPMYADLLDVTVPVFDDEGAFTEEFLALGMTT